MHFELEAIGQTPAWPLDSKVTNLVSMFGTQQKSCLLNALKSSTLGSESISMNAIPILLKPSSQIGLPHIVGPCPSSAWDARKNESLDTPTSQSRGFLPIFAGIINAPLGSPNLFAQTSPTEQYRSRIGLYIPFSISICSSGWTTFCQVTGLGPSPLVIRSRGNGFLVWQVPCKLSFLHSLKTSSPSCAAQSGSTQLPVSI